MTDKTVLNLSSVQLTESQLSVLQKGLSFIPTLKRLPISAIIQTKNDLIRQVRIKNAFLGDLPPLPPKSKNFTGKSLWNPSNFDLSKINTLDETLEITDLINLSTDKVLGSEGYDIKNRYIYIKDKPNLLPSEISALEQLRQLQNVVIKPADKGGCLVLMDVDSYNFEAYRQLSDPIYYEKIDKPIYLDNKIEVCNILKSLRDENYITKKQFSYLTGPDTPRQRQFYILPKIHKERDSWTIPDRMPTGRPIVSDVESESYRVSDYVEQFLKPLACGHPSYIKNSYDFIEKVRDLRVTEDTYLVTGDINALYTNMLHDRTISSISRAFNLHPDGNRPDTHLLTLLKLILEKNDFVFEGQTFLQKCGCPMGKIIGPQAANIYLIDFDYAAMNNYHIKPDYFSRFLDDVFFLWCDTLQHLKEYEDYLNSLMPQIKLKLEYSKFSINFLDVTIFKEERDGELILATKVYVKPTDTQNLLHKKSYHPSHTIKGILRSQLIRYKRLSSTYGDFLKSSKSLFKNLQGRGYSWSVMWKVLKEVWFNPQVPRYTLNKPLFPIIVPFSSIGKKLSYEYKKILNKYKSFQNRRIITAFKNNKNFAKLLVHKPKKL